MITHATLACMFLKPTRSGGHTYVQRVESCRNDAGQPRQRTVATLGRLDEIGGGVDPLLAGLPRVKGLPASAASSVSSVSSASSASPASPASPESPPQLELDSSLSYRTQAATET